jgi:hypothetical protein
LIISVDDQFFIEEDEEQQETDETEVEMDHEEATYEERETRTESTPQHSISSGSETDEYVLIIDENGDSHFKRSSQENSDHSNPPHLNDSGPGSIDHENDLAEEEGEVEVVVVQEQEQEEQDKGEENEQGEYSQHSVRSIDEFRPHDASVDSSTPLTCEQDHHDLLQKLVDTTPTTLSSRTERIKDWHLVEPGAEISIPIQTQEYSPATPVSVKRSLNPSQELVFVDIEAVLLQLSAIKNKTTQERSMQQVIFVLGIFV